MTDNKWKNFSEKYADVISSISNDERNRIGAWKPGLDAARDMLISETQKQMKRITRDDFECYGIPGDFDFETCMADIDTVIKSE
ncbi:MAG: hypothetical protein ACOX4P_01885 [Anaerovoracaceae bacterium]|jgi:hypothetical protein